MKQSGFDVECKNIKSISDEELRAYKLWVVGGPTHFGGARRKLRSLLKRSASDGEKRMAVTFDTRMKNVHRGGSEKLKALLTSSGIEVRSTEHFTVSGTKGPLVEGEEIRAMNFGRDLINIVPPDQV